MVEQPVFYPHYYVRVFKGPDFDVMRFVFAVFLRP
jgi:hypothetical protein